MRLFGVDILVMLECANVLQSYANDPTGLGSKDPAVLGLTALILCASES